MNWTNEFLMKKVDAVVRRPYPDGKYGWHEDQVGKYCPAIQQVRSEFVLLLQAVIDAGLVGGTCLQLGLGDGYSHQVWRCVFDFVCSIDNDASKIMKHQSYMNEDGVHSMFIWGDTHEGSGEVLKLPNDDRRYDFLFIDAGHLYEDVRRDYEMYSPLVRKGGIIAFHDTLPRPGHEVDKFLTKLPCELTFTGNVVGTAWMVKR